MTVLNCVRESRSRSGVRAVLRAAGAVGAVAVLAGCSAEGPGSGESIGESAAAQTCTDNSVTPPPDVTTATCPESINVNVGTATAGACGVPVPVSGEVVATNGVPLATPIPVVDGAVVLGPGTHTIRWTAQGLPIEPVEQTVVVNTGLQSGQSAVVGDRASVGIVTGSQSGPAALFNSGAGPALVRHDSSAGSVISVGPVTVFDRARLSGRVVSAGAVTVAPSAIVAGGVTPLADVELPPLPALLAFPPPALGSRVVNSGTTLALVPGSYAAVTVNSGATLVLDAGDYFFQTLNVNSGGVVTVANAAAGSANSATRVFVQSQLSLAGPFQGPGGVSLIPTVLGFAGAGNLTLTNNFIGTVVAPNADLTLGSGGNKQFIGAFYARVLQAGNDAQVLCNFLSAVGGQL